MAIWMEAGGGLHEFSREYTEVHHSLAQNHKITKIFQSLKLTYFLYIPRAEKMAKKIVDPTLN